MANTQTGTFDDPEDLLDQFRTFILAQSDCTELYYAAEGDGQRFHFTKTTGSNVAYFNLRAMIDEETTGSHSTIYYGLLVNESTSFDSADEALSQDGSYIITGSATGGAVLCSTATGQSCRFCSGDGFYSITVDGYNDIQQHIIGAGTEAFTGHICNTSFYGSNFDYAYNDHYNSFKFMLRTNANNHHYGCALIDGNNYWRDLYGKYDFSDAVKPVFGSLTQMGLIGDDVLDNSLNPNLGNPALLSFALAYGTSSDLMQADGISDIAFLNKKFFNNGEIIAIDGESWVIYEANYDLPDYGIAFKIS